MCPICIVTFGAVIVASTSTGAATTLAVRKVRRRVRKTPPETKTPLPGASK
jgi:hypothetical protein